MPVPSVAYFSLQNKQGLQQHKSLEECSGRSQEQRVWADTWDVKKVLDLLHARKASSRELYMSNTENSHDIGPSHRQEASDLNLLRITLWAMQRISKDSVTFQPVFGAKNARPNYPYCPTITLRQAEDERLCPVRLIKEYLAKTKDRED